MNKSDILTLYDYNSWANARILAAAARVTTEQYTETVGFSHGSIRGTLVHMLGSEIVWRMRIHEGISPTGALGEGHLPTIEALTARWHEEEAKMREFLASLTDEGLMRTVRYKSTKGVAFENPLWQLMMHVVNHGTQHRAEAGMALTRYGASPGDLDMILFFRERGF